MAPEAPSTTTASPGLSRSPASSRRRYATQYSRSIAACSSGIKSRGILRSVFSCAQNNERHAPKPGWRGSTQSPSARFFTPAPTFSTSPTKSPPAVAVFDASWIEPRTRSRPIESALKGSRASFPGSRDSFTRDEPASAPRLGARSAGFIGDARTCTSTCPHSSVAGMGALESTKASEAFFEAFEASETLFEASAALKRSSRATSTRNAEIFGKDTSSYDPRTTPYASTMSSTPMTRFASPRPRIHASNPAECECVSFLVFTSASARLCFATTSSAPRSLNAPPPNASRSSSSAERSIEPSAS